MRHVSFLFVVFFFSQAVTAQATCPVIPKPAKAERGAAIFTLSTSTSVFVSDKMLQPVASYLQNELQRSKNLRIGAGTKTKALPIQIVLSKKEKLTAEAYRLRMSKDGVKIIASGKAGAFYGVVSLLQLINQRSSAEETIAVPCWNISDAPLYGWRGLMLDESRHFFGKEKVKAILDWMAFYKLNRFHWHLTDEPAWRLQIKAYPLLTAVGAKGNYTNPAAEAKFYTQEDIKELVEYAAERQVTVIPEIDMPGHATAANRAYPQFNGGGSVKHPAFTFHPGNEETYTYLTTVLRETRSLFPSALLHIGGDEVSFGSEGWMTDPAVQKLMRKENLRNAKEVEQYFVKRMADSVYALNAKLLAWDEATDANLPAGKTIIFWWRQDKPEQLKTALQKGYNTVLCPRLPLYFDFVQDSTHTQGRKWNKAYNSIESVYNFTAASLPGVNDNNRPQILGIQANVWTETMPTAQRLDYMLFPRIAALAEAAWTPDANKNFQAFTQNLRSQFPLYAQRGLAYFNPF